MQVKKTADIEVLWFLTSAADDDLSIIARREFVEAKVERGIGRGEYGAKFSLGTDFSKGEFKKLNFQIIAKGTTLYSGDNATLTYPDPKEL